MRVALVALVALAAVGCKHDDKELPDPRKDELATKKAALFAKVREVVNKPPIVPPKPLAPIAKLDDSALIVTGDPKDLELQLAHTP